MGSGVLNVDMRARGAAADAYVQRRRRSRQYPAESSEVALYAEMRLRHRPGKMTAHVRKRIGAPHDPASLAASRLANVPAELIDYAATRTTYRMVGFAASTVEYQITVETTEHDLMLACETIWRAVASRARWGPRVRLLEVAISDEATSTTLLEGATSSRSALRPESIGLLGTGVLAAAWLVGGLVIADSTLHDDILIGASPPILAALVTGVCCWGRAAASRGRRERERRLASSRACTAAHGEPAPRQRGVASRA